MSIFCWERASARAVEVEPAEPEEEREKFNTCGHCQSMTLLDSRWTLCLFSTTPISRLTKMVNLLNMTMNSGAEEHVVSLADWKSLGEPLLKPAQVRLRSATGDDMGVSGRFVVRGWCDNQVVEFTALVATRATKISLFSNETGECWLQH